MSRNLVLVLLALVCAQSSFGQVATPRKTPLPRNVEEHHFASRLLGRDMSYRVILPSKYRVNKSARFPVIFLLHGLTGHSTNWTDLTKIEEYAKKYDLIIAMPEGGDGWYTDGESPNDKWESYIIQEFLPEIDKNFRAIPARNRRAIAGLSMGGYGALKFGLKFPDRFILVGSFSGAIDAPLRGQVHQFWRPSIMAIFGPEGSTTRRSNDIFQMVRDRSANDIGSLPFFYLDCGTEDTVNFTNNRDFSGLLLERKIPHEFRQLPGAHNWQYWDRQVQEFLRLADRTFAGHLPPEKVIGNN
jgi:putative tributyrin esterase